MTTNEMPFYNGNNGTNGSNGKNYSFGASKVQVTQKPKSATGSRVNITKSK